MAFRPWFSVLSGGPGISTAEHRALRMSTILNELLDASGDSRPGPRVNQPFHLPLGLY